MFVEHPLHGERRRRSRGAGTAAGLRLVALEIDGCGIGSTVVDRRRSRHANVRQEVDAGYELHGEKPLAGVLDQLAEAYEIGVHQPLQRAKLVFELQKRPWSLSAQHLEREPIAVL